MPVLRGGRGLPYHSDERRELGGGFRVCHCGGRRRVLVCWWSGTAAMEADALEGRRCVHREPARGRSYPRMALARLQVVSWHVSRDYIGKMNESQGMNRVVDGEWDMIR